jgi:hypothetical protein
MKEDVMTEGLVKRCFDCKAFEISTSECRRDPPIRLPRKFHGSATEGNRIRDETLIWGWPEVQKNDWCLKFKRKKKV